MLYSVLVAILLLCAVYAQENSTELFFSPLEDFQGMSAGYDDDSTAILGYNQTVDLGSCSSDYSSYGSCTSSSGYLGFCGSVSAGCCSTGVLQSNLCPKGSNDIKCCSQSHCSTPSGSGTCMQTSLCTSKGGTHYSGYCVGSSDLQCCVIGATPTTSHYGIDISTSVSSSSASCFKSNGYSFIVPRGYRSTGSVDSNVCTSLNHAKSAGIATRDVYFFPCPTCSKSATTQINEMVNYIKSNCASAWSGRIWLDIEGTQYWKGSSSANKSWFQTLVNACNASGHKCGVYASKSQWSALFGSTSFVYGNNLPLWYAHYDGKASFSDFSAFGGWTSPHAKQYVGDTTICSMGVDKNYSPSF